jgi:hypothetical protein
MSSPFVFPGSARSHESRYDTGTKHFNTFGDMDNETPNHHSSKKASNTPVENPLLFRPPSNDRNNIDYEQPLTSPLLSMSINAMGGGILRQRRVGADKISTETESTVTKTKRVLPPRASYSLGTSDVHLPPSIKTDATGNSSTKAKVSTRNVSSDSWKIESGDRSSMSVSRPSAFSFDDNTHMANADNSKSDTFRSPRATIDTMYSPSLVSLATKSLAIPDSNSMESAWVFVFGATINSELYELVTHTLSEFGRIVTHRSRSNWIAVRYQSELEAEKALCHKRMKFRYGGDIVYFTAQRLIPSDPEMQMVIQSSSFQPSTSEGKPISLWTTPDPSTVAHNERVNDCELVKNADQDDASDDTVRTKNSKFSVQNEQTKNEVTDEDIFEHPLNDQNRSRVAKTGALRQQDSLCVKLLKWTLSIEDDDYE